MMESEALKEFERGLRALYIQIPEGIADDIWQKWKDLKREIAGETARPSITDINNHNPDKFKK